jgi:hypothetical protein
VHPSVSSLRSAESLSLAGSHWCTAPSFEDGDALWAVVERDELEGVVAKPLNSRYTPGDRRAWLKVKNRAYWKYERDREAAIEQRHRNPRRRGRAQDVERGARTAVLKKQPAARSSEPFLIYDRIHHRSLGRDQLLTEELRLPLDCSSFRRYDGRLLSGSTREPSGRHRQREGSEGDARLRGRAPAVEPAMQSLSRNRQNDGKASHSLMLPRASGLRASCAPVNTPKRRISAVLSGD